MVNDEKSNKNAFCTDPESVVLVLHPSFRPKVAVGGGALEFDREEAVAPKHQKEFKDAMVKALNEFAKSKLSNGAIVNSCLRLDSNVDVKYPSVHIIRLSGGKLDPAEVDLFRAAANLLLEKVIPQGALGEIAPNCAALSADEIKTLDAQTRKIQEKFANKKIQHGFMVRRGPDDEYGVQVEGVISEVHLNEKGKELEGFAKPLGFDESSNAVFLRPVIEAKSEKDLEVILKERLVFKCDRPEMIETVARAYLNQCRLRYTAMRQRSTDGKKEDYWLVSLQAVATPSNQNNATEYELTPPAAISMDVIAAPAKSRSSDSRLRPQR
mgnify:CR=1 FL=1